MMTARRLCCLLAFAAMTAASQAGALEFRSVKETGSILYEAPALSARKLFVVSRYYPVEILSTQGEWGRVRDATGLIAWMPLSALSAQHMVLVVGERADVRSAAGVGAPVVFSVPRNGVLQLLSAPKDGWAHVRHRDGSSGYVSISLLWGL